MIWCVVGVAVIAVRVRLSVSGSVQRGLCRRDVLFVQQLGQPVSMCVCV